MPAPGRRRFGPILVFAFGILPEAAQADVFRDVAIGLAYTGFNIEGSKNHLSGGADFRISRNFVGNPLDFGAWDLTFQGPISLELSTGGRVLPQLDINLTTALTGDATAGPLAYLLNYDVGGQSTQIPGTLLIDAGLSLNKFGFYDLEFTYSSRQEVERSGRFANDDDTFDLDVGPINVSGNIYADALAAITQPVFERAGYGNPFASFSGSGSLSDWLTSSAVAVQKRLAAGDNPILEEQSNLLAAIPWDDYLHRREDGFGLRVQPPAVHGVDRAIPEPTVLILMLLGLPAIASKRIRRLMA